MSEQESDVTEVDEPEKDFEDTLSTDNVGEVSVEINVEELIAEIEGDQSIDLDDRSARKRLEDMLEEKRIWNDVMDMEDYDL
jgi:hypothetical protein